MPRRRMVIAGLALLAAMAPLLTGCSQTGRSASRAPAAGPPPVPLTVTGPGSPGKLNGFARAILTESGPYAAAVDELGNAAQVLTQRCMAAEHRRYYPYLPPPATGPRSIFYPPYGTLAERRADGYGISSHALAVIRSGRSLRSAPPAPEDSYRRRLPSARQASYDLALFGPRRRYLAVTQPGGLVVEVPGGGCAGQAGRELFGSVTTQSQVITGASLLSGMFKRAVETLPGYARLMHRWAGCMRGRGFRVPDPYSAHDSIYHKVYASGPTPALRRLEISVAVADFRCAGKVALVAGIAEMAHQVMRHLGHDFRGALLHDAAAAQAALRRAAALAPGSLPVP